MAVRSLLFTISLSLLILLFSCGTEGDQPDRPEAVSIAQTQAVPPTIAPVEPTPSPTMNPNVPTAVSEPVRFGETAFPDARAALEQLPEHLRRVHQSLADNPSPNLVNSYDIGERTEYALDFSWHCLRKEKSETLPRSGQIGVIVPDLDLVYCFEFHLPQGPVRTVVPTVPLFHGVDMLSHSFDLGFGLEGVVTFLPFDSSTLFAFLEIENKGPSRMNVGIRQVLTKDVFHYRSGYQRFPRCTRLGDFVLHARGTTEILEHPDGTEMNFEAWSWMHGQNGSRLGSMGTFFGADRMVSRTEKSTPPPPPFTGAHRAAQYEPHSEHKAIRVYDLSLQPGGRERLTTFVSLARFSDSVVEFPRGVVPFILGYRSVALALNRQKVRAGTAYDWPASLRERLEAYASYPTFDLPYKSWEAMTLSAMQLPRANTYSPEGTRSNPFYNFCRAYGNDLVRWWSYGMHAHESLSTFVTAVTNPKLAQQHLRGHFECQEEDGAFPYGVGQVSSPGKRVFFSANATPPFIAWESWNAYLWSGDRDFLEKAFEACEKNHDYWVNTRDRTGEGLCCWLDFGETVRDDGTVPTWRWEGAPVYFQEALDLNCYLLNKQKVLADMAEELGYEEKARHYRDLWNRRAHAMNALLWDAEDRCYYGTSEISDTRVRIKDISTLMPLWAGLAPAERAEFLVNYYRDPEIFQTQWPVPVLNRSDPTFLGDGHWHGSNWIQMTWLVIQGLRNYGLYNEASELAFRNIRMSYEEFNARSHLREYFNSMTGEGSSLNDYIWAALPAWFVLENFFGIEATREGISILPAPPSEKGWEDFSVTALRIRGVPLSLRVRIDPKVAVTAAFVNGSPWEPVLENRGILIPWERLEGNPDGLTVEIAQPIRIEETFAPPFPLPENVLEPMQGPPRIVPTQEELAFMNDMGRDRQIRYSHRPMPVVKPPLRTR